jgi:hypothetical protein
MPKAIDQNQPPNNATLTSAYESLKKGTMGSSFEAQK